ncbi:hypothetical protein HK100_002033 [Physocladia obscura]|uniref:Nephrocystin 3-like N-terminal domain-containing protein n=1 Tax=Physocladia obscura TaxID=109957 RepID=A0AAD5T7D3_9FUNG|nr:hypothetical protein HK100_002033 [Physocladia obscura]
MKIQAIKVDNPRELDRAVTECHNLLAKYSALPSTSSIQLDSNTVKTLTNWLNPLTEDMRHETSRLLNSHVSGTRSWLLESVLDFLDPTTAASENRVLWLQGGPGVGKSVMSALTADKLRQRNLLGAVLYAKHDNEARNNPQQLINTMVFGLCEWSNEFSQLVLVIYQNNPKILQEPVSDIFKELISNPLKKLFAKNPTYSPVVIIADALDECGKIGERREILEIFSVHCKDLPPKIKLFITSRLEPDIVQAFSSLPTIALEPSNDQNKEDALIFSKHFLQTHSAEDVAIEQGPAILVENSAGVFVWLVVACKILELAATDCITLEEIKSTTLSTGAGNSGLDHLFSSMLNRIFSEAESSSLLHVLATIVCVFEPLTTQAIADLISLDLVVVTASVQKLDALLLFDTDTKTVRVFHKSIADYLTDSTRCLDTNFGVHLPTWHTCLALGTISYLNQFLHFNMCNLPINKLHKEVEDFAHEVSSHISSTAVYASAYFHKHIQEAHLKVLPEDLLDFLFFHNAHHWIELMSLLGKTGQIVHSVVSLQKSLSGISVSSLFQHMLQDVKRVLQQWFIPIEASALQVYCTAILMAPTESLFYKTYFPLLPPQIPVPAITPQAAQWPICINTLESHKDRVFAVAVSTDGQFVVSGSWDKTVKIWDVHTGAVQKTLLGHSDEVYAIAISADSQFIASGSSDRTVKLWDVQTGAVQKTLKGHSKAVRAVAISPGGQFIVSGSADTTVRIWDAQTGVVQKTLTGHTDYVRSVAISANEWFVVSGSSDKTVKIWNVESGEVLKTLEGHSTFVCSVAISVNEQFIVSGSDDTTVKIWDVETGTVQNTLVGHSNTVSTVAISADGCFVVSGSWDKTVKIWDVLTGAVQMTLEANYSIVYSVAVSRDGQFVVSGSDDMTVKIWDTQNAALQNSLDGHNDVVSVVAISTNEQLVVSGSKDNTLKIWNVQAGTVEKTLEGHSNAVYCIAISTDNQFIVSGSWDHSVIIWDVPMGKLLKKLIGHRHAVDSVTISADGHFVVSGSWDTTVIIWDVQSGKLYKRLEGHSGPVSALAISFDGQFVVSGSWDKRVKIWNMQTGIVQMTLEGHSGYITAVTISRDMQFVASGSWDESIKIWDRATRIVQNLENLTNYVYAVTVNASNNLISGSWDNTAKIWNAHTGALLKNSSAEKSFPPQESEYKFYAKTTADTHCLAIKDMWLCGINCNCFTWIAPEWRSEISVQGSLFACVNEKGALFCKIE